MHVFKNVNSVVASPRNEVIGIRPIQTQNFTLVPLHVVERRLRATGIPKLDALVVSTGHEQVLVVLRPGDAGDPHAV